MEGEIGIVKGLVQEISATEETLLANSGDNKLEIELMKLRLATMEKDVEKLANK